MITKRATAIDEKEFQCEVCDWKFPARKGNISRPALRLFWSKLLKGEFNKMRILNIFECRLSRPFQWWQNLCQPQCSLVSSSIPVSHRFANNTLRFSDLTKGERRERRIPINFLHGARSDLSNGGKIFVRLQVVLSGEQSPCYLIQKILIVTPLWQEERDEKGDFWSTFLMENEQTFPMV